MKDGSFVGDCKLTSFSVVSDALAAEALLDATTGTITVPQGTNTKALQAGLPTKATEQGSAAIEEADLAETITAAGLTKDCLLVPTKLSEDLQDVTLNFTIDGKHYTVNFSGSNGIKLASGVQTDITLTVCPPSTTPTLSVWLQNVSKLHVRAVT